MSRGSDANSTPSPRSLRKARERGEAIVSHDLTAAIGLIGTAGLSAWGGVRLVHELATFFQRDWKSIHANEISAELIADRIVEVIGLLIPFLAGLMLLAVVARIAQTGFVFSLAKLAPQLPFRRPSFSVSPGSFLQLFLSISKISLVLAIAVFFVNRELDEITSMPGMNPSQIPSSIVRVASQFVATIGFGLLAIGLIDYVIKRRRFRTNVASQEQLERDIKPITNDTVRNAPRWRKRS